MEWLKRLKCKFLKGHKFRYKGQQFTELGMGKMFTYRCSCGATKAEFL